MDKKKKWVETFEKKNGRKPSVPEFQEAQKHHFYEETTQSIKNNQTPNVIGEKIKINKKIVIPVACLIIIALVGIYIYLSMPKSVAGKIADKVDFEGYDHAGHAKLGKYSSIIESAEKNNRYPVSVSLSKSEDLKNGEEITLAIAADKNSGIKSETKKIKVKGLKKLKKQDINDLLEEYPITFEGLDGDGSVSENIDDNKALAVDKAFNLNNGDEVTVSVKDDYLDNQYSKGVEFSGPSTKEITVSGLEDLGNISNIDEVAATIQSYVNSYHKNTSAAAYEIIPHKMFVFPTKSTSRTSLGSSQTPSDEISIVRIFEIKETPTGEGTKTFYDVFGYRSIPLRNNKVSINDLIPFYAFSPYSSLNSENAAFDSIKAGYPSMKEINTDK